LCNYGIPITEVNAASLVEKREHILADPGMSKIFVNPDTGNVWQMGDQYLWQNLGKTLEKIAKNGADEFYFGETAALMVEDLSKVGAIITREDLEKYE
jgi:gamma-glutamyltranspeptidase/glutathione hydrolase